MTNDVPHVDASYATGIGYGAIADFENEIAAPGLVFRAERRPKSGPFAGLDWLVPTAVMVLIGKHYFDSFLSEAGKDHYYILKKALTKLGQRFLATDTKLVYTKGKAQLDTPKYSLTFSIYGEIQGGLRLKLLVEPDIGPEELEKAIGAFSSALASIHEEKYQTGQVAGLEGAKPIGGTVLVTYDRNAAQLVVVNPLPDRAKLES